MANALLRLNKGATTAKLQLALFTASLDDNKDLAARVAHLESELAGVALSCGQEQEGFHALVAAAAAYRELGNLHASLHCLDRCRGLRAGDAETGALLTQAISDLKAQLAPPAAPKAAPAPPPPPAPKKEKAQEKPKKGLFGRKPKKAPKKASE